MSEHEDEMDRQESGATAEDGRVGAQTNAREGGEPADEPEAAADRGAQGAGLSDDDELSAEIRAELEELESLRERHLRLAAEYDNFRKRTRREMAEARERAQADLVGRLLDALDDLQRVLDTPAAATTVEALHEGVELVGRKLHKELTEAGLEPIEAEGQPFDPHFHEALLTTPVADADRDGLVSRVLVTGYRFGDRVLRPARVEVMKHAPSGSEADGGAG